MIEAIKRLIMALVFFYLGGLVCGTGVSIGFGNEGLDALQCGAMWPFYMYQLMMLMHGTPAC